MNEVRPGWGHQEIKEQSKLGDQLWAVFAGEMTQDDDGGGGADISSNIKDIIIIEHKSQIFSVTTLRARTYGVVSLLLFFFKNIICGLFLACCLLFTLCVYPLMIPHIVCVCV